MFFLVMAVALALPTRSTFAFSDTGHHVIAVIGFNLLTAEEQAEVIRVLAANPRFTEDFTPPESISGDTEAVARWTIGVAGEWPDIIRSVPALTRPTWHYQLGANLIVGGADAPDAPGPVPSDATLETRDLYIGQAIGLCRAIWKDQTRSDRDRAVALCWLAHLVADSHQPCHAGSLYSPIAFPDGDRGANSIKLTNGGNMHALWDGLLGRNASAGDVQRRVVEITSEPTNTLAGLYAVDGPEDLDPATWLSESRAAAVLYVYSPQVIDAVNAVERGLVTEFTTLTVPDDYLTMAGRVAQLRAAQAGYRFAEIMREGLE
jgi:hypothetical protein